MQDSRGWSTALRALVASGVVAIAIAVLGAGSAYAQAPVDVLVFHGPSNPTNDAGVAAIEALGAENDFDVDPTADPAAFTTSNLGGYRAVVFLNSSGDRLNAAQEGAFQAFIENGGGFVGVGTSAEAEPGTGFFDGLIGARPSATSPTAETLQTVAVGDRVHPATKDLPLVWPRTDVWYQWQTRPTGTVHTVARYHAPNAPAGDGTNTGGTDHPISWCRDFQGGRSFYTGMGRTAASYDDGLSEHLLGGIQWAAGLVRANCKATIYSNYQGTRLVGGGATSTGLATSGESHGVAIAPNGWAIYIGRGDCRSDAERGALVGQASLPRILDHSNPNVGLGCGSVHVWDPEAYDGTLNSGVTRAGTLAVYGDGGTDGERTNQGNHKLEWGLLGVTVAPDFSETGHIYLQYFPSFNPETSPPGLGIDRRISKISRPRISRFTIDLETKQLDLESEVRIFEYDAQIFSCCHVGGGMAFDSEGNLYVTTGDTNSSQGTNGYSGNNPTAKCPTGPADEASSAHCGQTNLSYQDARRTAGNTNDYNGKMLRIDPIDTIADGTQPAVGIGTTYTIPGADAPNGPNLFSGAEGNGNQAKPEIYAMGLRNPSRLSIDPETDIPYSGWVGPDAGGPSGTQGPSTYESLSQIDRAGNYGWPYCMGSKQAYRDRIVNPSDPNQSILRTVNAPGYVSGGPATGGTDGWYDCDDLVNDSPNNTGLTTLPHATGTGMDAGEVRPVNVWYSRGNPDNDPAPGTNNNNGCPEFPRDRGATNAPNYGAVPAQLCPWATASGATVMDGPIYRFDEGAEDNSRRWPEYWDGRWFIHDFGNNSVKHAVQLDPDSAADGGQPAYVDSLRNMLSWGNNYMDSKFGPDGALYVQVYDGFFRAGSGVGLYRFDYIGGDATPGASATGTPTVGAAPLVVQFNGSRSLGVSYEWDFGDGTAPSTEADPTHTYTTPGEFTATLTVTYADGSESTDEVEVNVLEEDDETPPTTTAEFDPPEPGDGGTYDRPVTLTFEATDNDGGTGVDKIEYNVDGAGFQEYTGAVRIVQLGDHVVQYRATDLAGNVETAKQVTFTIELDEQCDTGSDEFDGTALDMDRWDVLRPGTGLTVSGGRLNIDVREGDMIGGTASAQNLVLQDAPFSPWVAETKFDVTELTAGGEQAGLVVWQSEDPNNFVKVVFIHKPDGAEWFEYVLTTDGTTRRLPNTGGLGEVTGDVHLRAISNGTGTIVAEYSRDGAAWQQIGPVVTELSGDLRVGVKVSNNADSDHTAKFDYFHIDCADRAAPVTTASVDPEDPNGELGWYDSAPTLTLDATDGDLGAGVARTEYRYGTSGVFQTYTGPVEIDREGPLTIQYRSVDAAETPNTEELKTLSLKVDASAPTTTATLDPPQSGGDAPVAVTLDADDGDGSGIETTEYRVDGGEWQTYSGPPEEAAIFDGTQASLDQWEQAPSGEFVLQPDGSIRPVGGLGMLWYPVEQYGDVALRFEFRDARTDSGFSNGGAFVRFPDPRMPVAQRPDCGKVGNAITQQAWVAIYCGQEIQIYDGPTGEVQKTGSIYNFDPNDLEQAKPTQKGEWNDYEVRVVGQQYTIIRNGEVINTFDNAIPKESSRGGDPPTQQRQFAEGFVGLQNHGGPDLVEYRNVRVQELTDDTRTGTGPFTVTGRGNHTVEFRSIDWAGHMEEKQSVTFRIGTDTQPTPPGGGGTPPPGGGTPPPADEPATFRLARPAKSSVAQFTRRGLKVRVTCTEAMSGSASLKVTRGTARKLRLGSTTTLARQSIRCASAGSRTVTLKPSAKVKRALRRARGSVKVTLDVRLRAPGEAMKKATRRLTLARR